MSNPLYNIFYLETTSDLHKLFSITRTYIKMWSERAIEALRKEGFRLTSLRLKLLEVLDRIGERHPSLTEVFMEVKKDMPSVSFSTLYSNVLTLRELKLLELLPLGKETHIELNTDPHINVVEDGKVVDLYDQEILNLIRSKVGDVRLVNVFLKH